jgi:hypothetical protein
MASQKTRRSRDQNATAIRGGTHGFRPSRDMRLHHTQDK